MVGFLVTLLHVIIANSLSNASNIILVKALAFWGVFYMLGESL